MKKPKEELQILEELEALAGVIQAKAQRFTFVVTDEQERSKNGKRHNNDQAQCECLGRH